MARRVAKKFPHPVTYAAGPFVGMNDSPNPRQADPTLCTVMVNVAPDLSLGSGVRGRPPIMVFNSAQQMATGADGQGVIQHMTKAGVRYTFLVCGGKLYRVTWTGTLTATLTDVTPVGVTINASATHVYGVTFDDVIIVSDGVNRPWKMTNLSSTPVTGAYLTDMPGAAYGPPAIYYAKLFFIKADERDTIVWSEEADPDTGYEAGVNDNAWTLGQTDQSPLTCLASTNEALYYFRARSVGRILGAVESDFVTSGVHDSVSVTDGTVSPAAVRLVERDVYFLDDQGLPHVIRSGGVLEDISGPVTQTLSNAALVANADLPLAFATYAHEMGLLLIGHPSVSIGTLRGMLAYHIESRQWFGYWYLGDATYDICTAGVTIDGDGHQRVVILDTAGYAAALSFHREYFTADRLMVTGTLTSVAYGPLVVGPWMGYSDTVNQVFDRIDVTALARALSGARTYGVVVQTPSMTTASAGLVLPAGGTADLDVSAALGVNAHGRGARVQISHSSTSTLFSLSHLRISGTAVSDSPGQG